MNSNNNGQHESHKSISYFMNTKNWWGPLVFILVISVLGVGLIGLQTYQDAPPFEQFTNAQHQVLISKENLLKGQEVFHKYNLMEYGSFFGDGAQRGPDFTAEALYQTTKNINAYYASQIRQETGNTPSDADLSVINKKTQTELKQNTYDEKNKSIVVNEAKADAVIKLRSYYNDLFFANNGDQAFLPKGYIKEPSDVEALSDFFYWGAWVCVTSRPGEIFSYTHNWPFDPDAGNTPTSPVILWSVLGLLGFVLSCGVVLYFIGQYNQLPNKFFKPATKDLFTVDKVRSFTPTRSQRATYKFFLVAAILFVVQVTSGIITINDFIRFLDYFGIHITQQLPVIIPRSWHLMLALYWISTCWIASSIFILPILSKTEPQWQLRLINTLFILLFLLVAGSLTGMVIGPLGLLGDYWRYWGSQGWEFVDFGRIYQILLMVIFAVWAIIVYRGIRPALIKGQHWNLPNWILYSVIGIPLLFLSGFVAKPETNFVIADFWRWMVVHMWVEAFFEVFITVIVSYLMVLMGLVSRQAAIRVVYFATLLFLGTGLLGISHNFYWNAKPVATMALGSVFSTLQFVPLILLTVEAWRFKNLPKIAVGNVEHKELKDFGFPIVFLFLVAVNFWNFFGAGVLGIIVNLPIMNYFEHGTYLTINHAHASLMGVYGNISLAALLFATRLLVDPDHWNLKVLRFSFWSINIGLMLMVVMDLFPAGAIQFKTVVEKGLWYGRSHHFIEGGLFAKLTWMRGIGASVFYFGGVLPLTWFVLTRAKYIKKASKNIEPETTNMEEYIPEQTKEPVY